MEQGKIQENTGSGGLELNGEAWKEKNTTTYTSILDLYGAADLFSNERTMLYETKYSMEQQMQEELEEYLFSGNMKQNVSEDEALTDYLFSGQLELSKVKDYTAVKEDYMLCLILAAILLCMIFGMITAGYNRKRRKRRESFATEINMEDIRTE